MIGKVAGSSRPVAQKMGKKEKVKPSPEDILFIYKPYKILEFFAGNGNAKKCVFPSTISRVSLLPFSPTYLPPLPSPHGLAPPDMYFRSITCGGGSPPSIGSPGKRGYGRGSPLKWEPHELRRTVSH